MMDKGQIITGLNFTAETPRMSYGDYGGRAVLVELSETEDTLTITIEAKGGEA
jgi:hypothetical protein